MNGSLNSVGSNQKEEHKCSCKKGNCEKCENGGKCEKCENGEKCNKQKGGTNMDKWRYTLYTTVLFLLIVNPLTYKFVNKLLGKVVKIADNTGCPTPTGMLVHAFVFTLLLRGLMEFKI